MIPDLDKILKMSVLFAAVYIVLKAVVRKKQNG